MPERITDTKRGVDVEGMVWVADESLQDAYRFLASIPQKVLRGAKEAFSIEEFVLDREIKMLRMVIGS